MVHRPTPHRTVDAERTSHPAMTQTRPGSSIWAAGLTMLGYLRRFGDAQGVDADERAGFCRARGEGRVQVLESEILPFPDDAFDLVTALDVLEHIENDRAALREWLACCDRAACCWPRSRHMGGCGASRMISHHFRRYTASQLRQRIQEARFEAKRMTYFNTILFPPIAAVRLARRVRPGQALARSDFGMTPEGRVNRILAGVFLGGALAARPGPSDRCLAPGRGHRSR